MIYTEEQAEKVLNHEGNLLNNIESSEGGLIVEKLKRGGSNAERLSTSERSLAGAMARAGLGTTEEIGDLFGVARQTVGNYKEGRVGHPSKPTYVYHPEMEEALPDKLTQVQDKALEKLMSALGIISDEKLNDCTAVQASTIARNMSAVVKDATPNIQDNRTLIIMHAPRQKSLDEFKMVEVS
jgi:hypothetical protein